MAHKARKPTDIPPRGWWNVLKRAWKESGEDHLEMLGAAVAFYAFSALVPLLTALVLTYGLVAEPSSVVQHMQTLTSVMPAESAGIIGDQLQSMTESDGAKTGFALLLAFGIALYGASKGATSIMTALNMAYETEETRGFVKRTAIAIGLVAGAVLVMLLAILAFSAMNFVEQLMPWLGGIGHFLVQALSFAIAAATVITVLAVIYRYGPDRPNAKWRWITPGSVLATVVWLVATVGFGFYVSNFGNYNATYGSLGAVIVFLTWLYLSAYIVLLGAEVNAVLEQEVAANPKAEDSEQPEAVAARADPEPESLGSLAARFAAASVVAALLRRKDKRTA
jgi:membrane protein